MPKTSYPLEEGGIKRLTVSWKTSLKDTSVELDGKVIGMIPGQKELYNGQTFTLPDGSVLEVKFVRSWAGSEMRVLRNGKPLPGSGSDPRKRLKQSYGIIYFVGGINFALGLIAWIFQVNFLLQLGMGFYSIIVGGIYLLLAFFVQKRSMAALIIAMLLYGAETILIGLSGAYSGIVVRILVMVVMWTGFGAIKALRAEGEKVVEYEG